MTNCGFKELDSSENLYSRMRYALTSYHGVSSNEPSGNSFGSRRTTLLWSAWNAQGKLLFPAQEHPLGNGRWDEAPSPERCCRVSYRDGNSRERWADYLLSRCLCFPARTSLYQYLELFSRTSRASWECDWPITLIPEKSF